MNKQLTDVDAESTTDLVSKYLLPNYGRNPMAPLRGEGVWLWDENGKKHLDFAGGVAVNSLGHCSPVVRAALAEQSGRLIHCSNLYHVRLQAELAQILVEEVMQMPGRCFFCNSGTEANEAMLKLARRYGQLVPAKNGGERTEILTFSQSFHGRTWGSLSATAQPKIHEGFGPILSGFKYLPFNDVTALEQSVTASTVAILLEPLQGEGGVGAASPEFLRACAALAKEHDLLLLFDEIQCGLGRCGDLRGWKSFCDDPSIVPDAVSWAKSMGGGFPIGAMWVRSKSISADQASCLTEVLGVGRHGSTFGGSPLACAVSTAVLREIIDRDLMKNAGELGREIISTINEWKLPLIKEVRGKGLMLGLVIHEEALSSRKGFKESGKTPSAFMGGLLQEAGLLTAASGPDVLRWLPALNVTREEVLLALDITKKVFESQA